jgi:hypothetical protein
LGAAVGFERGGNSVVESDVVESPPRLVGAVDAELWDDDEGADDMDEEDVRLCCCDILGGVLDDC